MSASASVEVAWVVLALLYIVSRAATLVTNAASSSTLFCLSVRSDSSLPLCVWTAVYASVVTCILPFTTALGVALVADNVPPVLYVFSASAVVVLAVESAVGDPFVNKSSYVFLVAKALSRNVLLFVVWVVCAFTASLTS